MNAKRFYIGLDVHKRSVTFAVRAWNGQLLLEGQCGHDFSDLWSTLEPYLHSSEVVLEACAHFYDLYHAFKERGIVVKVANVVQLRKLVAKNDVLDAKRLAEIARLNGLPESFIPGDQLCTLRSLTALHYTEVKTKTKLKNQIHAYLDQRAIRFPPRTAFCQEWCAAFEAYLEQHPSFELQHLYTAEKQSEQRLKEIDAQIQDYTKTHFQKDHTLLQSIPGIGTLWSAFLIANILPISRFANKKKLRRYAGVIPVSDTSDTRIYGTYIPKGSSRKMLRYVLVQAAHSAVQANCSLKPYYAKKKKQKQKAAQAIMCVASSLSDIIYQVLSTGKPYSQRGAVVSPMP